jgi:hypothetical protein
VIGESRDLVYRGLSAAQHRLLQGWHAAIDPPLPGAIWNS